MDKFIKEEYKRYRESEVEQYYAVNINGMVKVKDVLSFSDEEDIERCIVWVKEGDVIKEIERLRKALGDIAEYSDNRAADDDYRDLNGHLDDMIDLAKQALSEVKKGE